MLNLIAFVDPLGPVTDGKVTALALVSVGLFIGNAIQTYLINDKLASLKKFTEKQEVVNTDAKELQKAIDGKLDKTLESLDTLSDEHHEKWAILNQLKTTQGETQIHVQDIKETVDASQEQVTALAAAVKTGESHMQQIISGLLDMVRPSKHRGD